MKNTLKYLVIAGSLLVGQVSYAHEALYLTENRVIDWIKQNDDGTFKIYLTDKDTGKYGKRTVQQNEISLRAKHGVNNFKYGWALVANQAANVYEHCQVTDIFQNARVEAFCDLIENDKQVRKYYSGTTEQFVSQIESLDGISEGDRLQLKSDVKHYKKGLRIKVRAVFANKTALVQEDTIGTFLVKGPYENAVSVVVGLDQLERNAEAGQGVEVLVAP